MPQFSYIAKSLDGNTEEGFLNANNEGEVAMALKSRGLILISATDKSQKSKIKLNTQISLLPVSMVEKIMMTRNMEVMFSTGLPLVKIFEILFIQSRNKKAKTALADVKDRIVKGESLSDSLAWHPKIFSELFVSMVRVGEESGTLEDILKVLALQFSKEYELKSKVRNALIYPGIILMVMVMVGGVMVYFVLPNLKVFFESLDSQLPIYTRVILWLGDFLAVYWYTVFIVPLALVYLFWKILKTKIGKKVFDGLLLKLVVIRDIVKKTNSALFIRSLSSLIKAGVPLTRGLEIISNTMGNYYYKRAIRQSSEKIKKGEKLSAALRAYDDIFPYGVLEMIEVGEETGKTAEILEKLSEFYEQEAMRGIEKLTIMIEPIMIICLGLGVGVFVVSIIEPIYSSLEAVNQ